jgi:hypothetical protein
MIYSPSQSKVYLTCPTARMLSQEGWTSRVIGIRDWVAWIGQGVHAGLATRYSGKGLLSQAGVLRSGYYAFQAEYEHALTSGRLIPNTFFVSEAKAHIERCLQYAMANDVLPAGFEVERVEQPLGPDTGNCILDVVGKRNGKPTFIDWKVKNTCKPDYIDQELEKYRYDWKEARHYPWALSEVCGQRVEEYTIVLFILSPQFKVVQRTFQVNWPVVTRWADDCSGLEGLWNTMDPARKESIEYQTDPLKVWQSNACMGGQWPCEYLDACWTYDLDREKMKAGGLVQVERLRNQTLASSQEE